MFSGSGRRALRTLVKMRMNALGFRVRAQGFGFRVREVQEG